MNRSPFPSGVHDVGDTRDVPAIVQERLNRTHSARRSRDQAPGLVLKDDALQSGVQMENSCQTPTDSERRGAGSTRAGRCSQSIFRSDHQRPSRRPCGSRRAKKTAACRNCQGPRRAAASRPVRNRPDQSPQRFPAPAFFVDQRTTTGRIEVRRAVRLYPDVLFDGSRGTTRECQSRSIEAHAAKSAPCGVDDVPRRRKDGMAPVHRQPPHVARIERDHREARILDGPLPRREENGPSVGQNTGPAVRGFGICLTDSRQPLRFRSAACRHAIQPIAVLGREHEHVIRAPAQADQRVIGIIAALVLRIIFALMVTQLMQIVGLIFAGGILLLWVAWRMYRELRATPDDPRRRPATRRRACGRPRASPAPPGRSRSPTSR